MSNQTVLDLVTVEQLHADWETAAGVERDAFAARLLDAVPGLVRELRHTNSDLAVAVHEAAAAREALRYARVVVATYAAARFGGMRDDNAAQVLTRIDTALDTRMGDPA